METLEWVDADGATHPIANPLWDLIGLRDAPPGRVQLSSIPSGQGARVLSARDLERSMTVPFLVQAATAEALRDEVGLWMHRFRSSRGAGTLRITRNGGDIRQIVAYPQAALAPDTDADNFLTAQICVVELVAPDPYWEGATSESETFMTTGGPVSWFPFYLPGPTLGESQVIGTVEVSNVGTADAYPMWTITGPTTSLTLENLTTGKQLAAPLVIAAGDTVTISTAPPEPYIEDSGGVSLLAQLTSRQFWPLVPGMNSISVVLGSTTSQSQVDVSWRPRWDAA